jgi:hypothetical protein
MLKEDKESEEVSLRKEEERLLMGNKREGEEEG